ncbi:MAG TPA: ATP-binding protein, partial [Casimicrobiaceae bacterium]|nr:ATP-binding protein [Casimicrobiaceae bacterium]
GEDAQRAATMTAALTRYLRQAIPDMRGESSTLGRELELARAYLEIMTIRMERRLAYSVEAPAGLASLPFPPLLLATLVENAIRHGIEPKPGGGRVDVRAFAIDRRLIVEVADTGAGFATESGSGVGLANTRERLAALYGDAAGLELEANEPSGVVARVWIPLAQHDADRADR